MIHAVVINLARRPERLAAFRERFARWPDPIERIDAVDSQNVTPPEWYDLGPRGANAWACRCSHIAALDLAMARGWNHLLIFEDDAIPRHAIDPYQTTSLLMTSAPPGWDILYAGGQHLRPPVREIGCPLLRCRNVNRTHAYIVAGSALEKVHAFLLDLENWKQHPKAHIDHYYGTICERWRVYAPPLWIFGQAGGRSDISPNIYPARFWRLKEPAK